MRGATLALLLSVLACSDMGPESALSGTWTGSASGASMTLTLAENNGSVSGSGNLSASAGAAALTASGTHSGANVSLTLSSDEYESFNFSATVAETGKSMAGQFNGSGFQNFAFTLTRP